MKYFLGYKEDNKYNKMTDLTPNNKILTLAKFTSNFNNKEELFNYLKSSTFYFTNIDIDNIDDKFFQYINNNGPIDDNNIIIYKNNKDLIDPNAIAKSFVKKIDSFDYNFILNYTFNTLNKYFKDIYNTLYKITGIDYYYKSKESIVSKIIEINNNTNKFIKNPEISNFLLPIYILVKDAYYNPNLITEKYMLHLRRYAYQYLKFACYGMDEKNPKLNERNLFDILENYLISINNNEYVEEKDDSDDEFLEESDYPSKDEAIGDSSYQRALEKRHINNNGRLS